MYPHLKAAELSHALLEKLIRPGQTVIDATAGKGHDTLFLAQQVQKEGKVYAFDVQEEALAYTRQLLAAHGLLEQTELIRDSHVFLRRYVQEPVSAAIYNLGYLPGGDKKIITAADTTLASLRECMELLAPGGVIAVVVYPGHPGGEQEAACVEAYLGNLAAPPWYVFSWKRVNHKVPAPYLLMVEKQNCR
ncbi:MAG: class I SAM-dependent methyltransferase [Clostridia bacterium]|jgi:predicted methyltransferase|nr:class I SAM-dependent methyltransferase [Clostridia bacterium]